MPGSELKPMVGKKGRRNAHGSQLGSHKNLGWAMGKVRAQAGWGGAGRLQYRAGLHTRVNQINVARITNQGNKSTKTNLRILKST